MEKLSNDELQNLLDNEKDFEKYFLSIKGVKELGDSFSQLMQTLKSQAEENLKAKQDIDKLYNEYLDVRHEYEELKQQEQEIMMKLSTYTFKFWNIPYN